MIRSTCAYIDLNNLKANIAFIKSHLQPQTRFLAVVKANAYGHGIVPVARAAVKAGADYLGVAIPEEGQLLRNNGIQNPVLVLGGVEPDYAPLFVENDLIPAIYSIPMLQALQSNASKAGASVQVHLKIDTGMNRIGIKTVAELQNILAFIRQHCPNIRISGMFSHFAVSEIGNKTFTLQQDQQFMEMVRLVRAAGYAPMIHIANSAAILDLPQTHHDMVRGGIVMYGCRPDPGKDYGPLLPVLSWKTRITHIKHILPGETVGYGRTYTADRPVTVATIPVGYGDGYKRLLSNRASVLIGGQRAPIIGSVCMDQCMCDVSSIPDVQVGDEVVLLGQQGKACITAEEMAGWAETINYEILLSISDRVPRVYLEA